MISDNKEQNKSVILLGLNEKFYDKKTSMQKGIKKTLGLIKIAFLAALIEQAAFHILIENVITTSIRASR